MDRRDFIGMAGCSFASLLATAVAAQSGEASREPAQKPVQQKRQNYKIEIEIFEARTDTWCHQKGDKFVYPMDMGRMCPWLRSSMHDFLRLLEMGVVLPWKYEKTPYEKVIDPNGVTTEYVRCPDPTSNLVAKITRTAVA